MLCSKNRNNNKNYELLILIAFEFDRILFEVSLIIRINLTIISPTDVIFITCQCNSTHF